MGARKGWYLIRISPCILLFYSQISRLLSMIALSLKAMEVKLFAYFYTEKE